MSGDPLDHSSNVQSEAPSNRDLLAVVAYAVVAAVVLAVGDPLPPAIRVPIALPLLLFVPGYAVVTALLPARFDSARSSKHDLGDSGPLGAGDGLTALERLTLAIVASLAVVPTVTLVANALVGVSLVPVLVGLVLVTLLAVVLAATRRRAAVASGRARQPAGSEVTLPRPTELIPGDALTLAAICIAVLLLGTSAAVAFTGATDDTTTELAIGTESGGEFVAEDYPETLVTNETATLDVAIEQSGADEREYEAVVALDRVTTGEDEATVLETTELDRFQTTVEPDERTVETVDLVLEDGDGAVVEGSGDHRIAVLLYETDAPDEPDHETAHRTVTLPIEVVDE